MRVFDFGEVVMKRFLKLVRHGFAVLFFAFFDMGVLSEWFVLFINKWKWSLGGGNYLANIVLCVFGLHLEGDLVKSRILVEIHASLLPNPNKMRKYLIGGGFLDQKYFTICE